MRSNLLRLPVAAQAAPVPKPRIPGQPWSVDELSAFTTLSRPTIERLVKAGRLVRLDVGRRIVVSDESVQRLIAGKATDAPQSVSSAGPADGSA